MADDPTDNHPLLHTLFDGDHVRTDQLPSLLHHEWLNDALCVKAAETTDTNGNPEADLSDFFVPARHQVSHNIAEMCVNCPVRRTCYDTADTLGLTGGYRAGFSARKRKDLSRDEALAIIAEETPHAR